MCPPPNLNTTDISMLRLRNYKSTSANISFFGVVCLGFFFCYISFKCSALFLIHLLLFNSKLIPSPSQQLLGVGGGDGAEDTNPENPDKIKY